MRPLHDSQDPEVQGTPSAETLAAAEREVAEACVGLPWCIDAGMDSHDPACPADAIARDLVVRGVWEYIHPCDHGSHHWCDPCMNPNYVGPDV